MASSSDAAAKGRRPAASDSDPDKNSVSTTPNRYMSMVAEMSASVSPIAPLYSEYKGIGTAEAANTVTKANVAMTRPRTPCRGCEDSDASTACASMAPSVRSPRITPVLFPARSDCGQHSIPNGRREHPRSPNAARTVLDFWYHGTDVLQCFRGRAAAPHAIRRRHQQALPCAHVATGTVHRSLRPQHPHKAGPLQPSRDHAVRVRCQQQRLERPLPHLRHLRRGRRRPGRLRLHLPRLPRVRRHVQALRGSGVDVSGRA